MLSNLPVYLLAQQRCRRSRLPVARVRTNRSPRVEHCEGCLCTRPQFSWAKRLKGDQRAAGPLSNGGSLALNLGKPVLDVLDVPRDRIVGPPVNPRRIVSGVNETDDQHSPHF